MKASNPFWVRTVCSSNQAETMPDWELSSDDGVSPCSAHHDSDTCSFNFSAPPGGYSLKGLTILKELFSISLPARFLLIKLHNRDTYSLALTVRDGPARVLNSVINSRAAEEAQMSVTMSRARLWTACALQLSSALQWPARRLLIAGVEATVCLHVPVPLPFSNYESLLLSLPSLTEDNFPLHAQSAATDTLFVCRHHKAMRALHASLLSDWTFDSPPSVLHDCTINNLHRLRLGTSERTKIRIGTWCPPGPLQHHSPLFSLP
eukprot:3542789-Rhodomonas_salina.1